MTQVRFNGYDLRLLRKATPMAVVGKSNLKKAARAVKQNDRRIGAWPDVVRIGNRAS